jgi:hypothetical protein
LLSEIIILLAPKRKILGLLSLLCLFSSAFQRQLYTAEVYLLLGVASLILLKLALSFYERGDVRYLFAFTFISGLGAGAHAAIVIPASIVIVCMLRKLSLKQASLAVMFGLGGLLIFSYLPLRASTNPPLNSGGISSIQEFFGFITNSRIESLRDESQSLTPKVIERVENFLIRLKHEVGFAWMALGFLGLGVWIYRKRSSGLLIGIFAACSFVTFLSWDPDPWMLGIGLLTVGVAGIFALIQNHSLQKIAVAGALIVPSYLIPPGSLANYYAPDEAGLELLRDSNSVQLLEPGWFLGKSASKIYMRDDGAVLFTPALLYPEAFSNTEISLAAQTIDARGVKGLHPEHSQFAPLSAIFKAASELQPPLSFKLQPTQLTNSSLKNLLILEDGQATIRPGVQGGIATSFPYELSTLFLRYRKILLESAPLARSDAQNYYESLVLGWTDLLTKMHEEKLALSGLDVFCGNAYAGVCSVVSINNYALKLIEDGRTAEATKLLADAMGGAGDKRAVIRHNLAFAVSKLKGELSDD